MEIETLKNYYMDKICWFLFYLLIGDYLFLLKKRKIKNRVELQNKRRNSNVYIMKYKTFYYWFIVENLFFKSKLKIVIWLANKSFVNPEKFI